MNTLIYSVTDCSQCYLIVKYVFVNSNLSPIKRTVKLEYDRDGNYQYNITRAIARIFEELKHDGISCNKSDSQVIIL